MKRCPRCNSIYTNDQLIYCLADGATLESRHTFDSAPTIIANPSFSVPPVMSPQPPVISQSQEKVGRGILSIALIIMLAAGVVIGLLIAFILLRPPATPMSSQPAQNQNSNIAVTNSAQVKPRETATPSPAKPSMASANSASSQDVRWFVVLGTFQASDSASANERLEQMRAEGFKDAYIVDTNGYSNFTPHRLAVVLGPYTESDARSAGSRVRSLNPTIKPGW